MRAALCLLVAAGLLAGCGGGGHRLSGGALPAGRAALRVSSPAFADGGRLPRRFTCDGAGAEPIVRAAGVPARAVELALVVSDPDAPGGTFVHLTRYGIAPDGGGAPVRGGRAGRNSAGGTGWTAPCPPKGAAPHRYVWAVYALRRRIRLPAGADPDAVTKALRRAGVVASGALTARYGR